MVQYDQLYMLVVPSRNMMKRLNWKHLEWSGLHFRSYLYRHRCDAYCDHRALKSLLNTPQPSGRLARWGMALQELDIHIHYRPGKANNNLDALSRCTTTQISDSDVSWKVLAAVQADVQLVKEGGRKP